MYMADMNTKNTGGIMEEETVFAFAASEQALDLTVLNERVRLDISWLTSAYGAVADYVGLCWQCAKGSIQILADKGEQFIQLAAPYVQAAGQTLERLLLALVGIGRV